MSKPLQLIKSLGFHFIWAVVCLIIGLIGIITSLIKYETAFNPYTIYSTIIITSGFTMYLLNNSNEVENRLNKLEEDIRNE